MKLYEILIPEVTNRGVSTFDTRKSFETYIFEKLGGFTRLSSVYGAWRGRGGDFFERMVPYRVLCTEDIFADITAEAFLFFDDQEAIFISEIGEAQIVHRVPTVSQALRACPV